MTSTRHILHVFSTFCPAGPQVRATMLMRGFGHDFRHTVIACDGRTEAKSLVADAAELKTLPWAPPSGAMSGVRFVRDVLAAEKPDLLLTYNWGAMDAVLAARTSRFDAHVHHEDGFNADETEKLKARRNWTRRLSLRSTDVVVPSSKLETIARKTWRLPRVHLVPNGVDAVQYAHDPAAGSAFRSRFGIAEDAFVVGAVGHLRPVKNFGRLIRAMAGAPFPEGIKPHLLIIGDGAERERLEGVAAAAPDLDVTFAGHIEDLAPAYSALDVFSLSSDSEQQPVSLLEAMACGVAVAATDVGDISPTLPAEARVNVVPLGPSVESSLGVALARLAADPEHRRKLGALGHGRAMETYSEAAMVETYRRIYETAIDR